MSDLQAPPRHVPTLLALRCLVGGRTQQLCWLVLSVLLALMLYGGSFAELGRWMSFKGERGNTSAEIVRVEETNSEENDASVFAYSFRYEVDGQAYEEESYIRDTGSGGHRPGDKLPAEYLLNDPGFARLLGMRVIESGFFVFLALGVLLLGLLGTIGFEIMKGAKGCYLLARGATGTAEFVLAEELADNWHRLTFRFDIPDGRKQTIQVRTKNPRRLMDDDKERVLYASSAPEFAVMFDTLPGGAAVTKAGGLAPGSLSQTLQVFLLPGLAILLGLVGFMVVIA